MDNYGMHCTFLFILYDSVVEKRRDREGPDMMNSTKLERINKWLINNIFRNECVMFNDNIRNVSSTDGHFDIASVIASLANLLYEEMYEEPYDYFFHWANKIGASVDEHFFDNIMRGE